MKFIYHITPGETWNQAQVAGLLKQPSLDTEGFIHCCKEEQVLHVLNHYFKEVSGLVLLKIDVDLLKSKLQVEWVESSKDSFPHVYGPINTNSIVEVKNL